MLNLNEQPEISRDNVDNYPGFPQRVLSDGLLTSINLYKDKVAIIVEGKEYTYRDLYDSSSRLANALIHKDIVRGDRVAIYMDNSWQCIVSIYAVILSGGVFLLINPQTKAEKLEYILDNSGAKVLITDAFLENICLQKLNNNGLLHSIITTLPEINGYSTDNITFDSFQELIENSELIPEPVKVIPNDLAALIYTSGSTGVPKGVMQTHHSMVFSAWSLIEYQRLSKNDRILLVLPLAFDYGLYQLLMSVKLGATLIVERSFAFPTEVFKRLKQHSVTVFPAVPTIFSLMISFHKKKKMEFPQVTRITSTAAVLHANSIPYLHEIFPNALIFKMYGLTECKRVSYLEPELIDAKPTSVGRAIPGTEIYLLTEDGKQVPPEKPGILYVRGQHVMLGYWNDPESSKKMLKPGKLPGERVLCTHDLFKMDEEGYLYFIGRSDDIIKTRGEKISPIEIENILLKLSGVKEVAIIGIPHDILGQSIIAYIVVDKNSNLDLKKIRKYCLLNLEKNMFPESIYFVDVLPKTPNGKIDKLLLAKTNSEAI